MAHNGDSAVTVRGNKKRGLSFREAAQAIITNKGSTDFTVQEVVDRAGQSLRRFYQHFDGKHELLLALFEEAMLRVTEQARAAAAGDLDPLDALLAAATVLFELSRPDPAGQRPLFTDLARQLRWSHPAEVGAARAPLLDLLTGLMTQAGQAGRLHPGTTPRCAAALTMQTAMSIAESSGAGDGDSGDPVTAGEVWDFCSPGFARYGEAQP